MLEVLHLLIVGEAIRDREDALIAAELFDDGQPLLLVHVVTGDQEGEQVLHPGVVGHVVEAGRKDPARGFGDDVGVHVGREVAVCIDVGSVERNAVGIDRHRVESDREIVLGAHATEDGRHGRVLGDRLILQRRRCAFEVQGHGGREHLDMGNLFGCGGEQHVPVLRVALCPALEEVLQADANLALNATDRLLEHTSEAWVRGVDAYRILEFAVGEEHTSTSW